MACYEGSTYSGDDKTNYSWTNWNGDVVFDPDQLRAPKNIASLVEVVKEATEKKQSIHAVGHWWAFEDCAKADGVMVSLEKLNHRLEYVVDPMNNALTDDWIGRHGNPNSPTHLVHFEAGIRILDLCEKLDEKGLAMPTLGGSNGQALAGAISTSTHGGDWQQPPLPDVVRAIHLVTVGGQELWIERASNPLTRDDDDNKALLDVLPCKDTRVVRDDRVFDAVRVACGRFGVIYSLVLEVRRQFRVVQVVTTPSAAAVLKALRDGQNTPSVFTPLLRLLNNDPVPAGLEDAQGVPYFFELVFNSQRPSDVWARRRWVTTDPNKPDRLNPPYKSQQELAKQIIGVLHGALAADGLVAGIEVAVLTAILGPLGSTIGTHVGITTTVALADVVANLDYLLVSGKAPFGSLLAAALTAAWDIQGLNYLIPQIQGMVIEDQLRGGSTKGGARGPHFRVTTGWREDSDQNDFRSDSIEVVFDATMSGYLDFLDEILPVAPLFQQAGYVSVRPSLSSSALLSMHNVSGSRAISIEIASVKNLRGNGAWMSYLHQAAVRHNGRPHWGQYNKLDALNVAMLYGDALSEWREALFSVSGDSTVFSNDFTRQRGLEPTSIARAVTSVKKSSRGRITHLCHAGEPWSPVTASEAIKQIQAGTVRYVAVAGDSIAVIRVVRDGHGGFYLRTVSDKLAPNNLRNLPLCT
jgi:hypothetical protein